MFLNELVNMFFYISLGFLGLSCCFYLLFNYKKIETFRVLSLRFQIKNLLLISLLAASSVAIVFVLSQVSNFLTVIPSFRIAFQGVLVKISGFLFGPIVGIITAIITELVVLIFIPTYFYYQYLLVLICFGFFSGLIRHFVNRQPRMRWQWFIIFTGLLIFISFTLLFFVLSLNSINTEITSMSWVDIQKKFGQKYLQLNLETVMFFGNLLGFALLLGFLFFALIRIKKPGKFWTEINRNTLKDLLPILMLTVFSEYLISAFIASSANQSVFGEGNREAYLLFTTALVIAPIKIIFNTIIIYNVWKVFKPYFSNKIEF